MPYENFYGRNFRRPDKQVMFAVRLADGTSSYMRVSPELAKFGASPAVVRLARDRQSTGEVAAGEIVEVVRVK